MTEHDFHLGIDAVNIRQGGGLTHLSKLLQHADPIAAGFSSVTVWSAQVTAEALPTRPWLAKRSAPWMDQGMARRMFGQQFQLTQEIAGHECDLLFSPGGSLPYVCPVPMVTMSQNMLPFEPSEAARFGRLSLMRIKMWMLRYLQGRSFRRSSGVIFLTRYAERTVSAELKNLSCPTALISHGIESRFLLEPRPQRRIEDCSGERPFRLLYVSILMPYKHQVEVVKAVAALRVEGMPIEIVFIGESWGDYGEKFKRLIGVLDPCRKFLKWFGHKPFHTLHRVYRESDAFVFASSCENLPNILIEAMAAGLPIACSNRGPMPEVLGSGGLYFDPDQTVDIARALRELIASPQLRSELAEVSHRLAQRHSWDRCAAETFGFLSTIIKSCRDSHV